MNPDQLRHHLRRLSLTQNGLGRMLAVDVRTARRWASGHAPIPQSVELLLEHLEPAEAHRLLELA